MHFTKIVFYIFFCLSIKNLCSMELLTSLYPDIEEGYKMTTSRSCLDLLCNPRFIDALDRDLGGLEINNSIKQLSVILVQLSSETLSPNDLPLIYIEQHAITHAIKQPKQMIFSTNESKFAYINSETNVTHIFNTSTFTQLSSIEGITGPYTINFENEDVVKINSSTSKEQSHIPHIQHPILVLCYQNPDITAFSPKGNLFAVHTKTKPGQDRGFIRLFSKVSNPLQIALILILNGLCNYKEYRRSTGKNYIIRSLFSKIPKLITIWMTMTKVEQSNIEKYMGFNCREIGWF